MGVLVVRRYPTKLFAKAADHTYVECGGGGKAWACWGGKTGGAVLRQMPGSTDRADCIAQPDEKAGIKCYLINGVCHQAANRILLPAGITVRGARGYLVSHSMFGTYGRVGFWPCSAPFQMCSGSSGDLPACTSSAPAGRAQESDALSLADKLDWNYTRRVLAIYRRYEELFAPGTATAEQIEEFHLSIFSHMLEFQLGPLLSDDLKVRLLDVRRRTERRQVELEQVYATRDVSGPEYVNAFNELTISFQRMMAEEMTSAQYETLFELRKDEIVVLADPEIANAVFGAEGVGVS